MTLIKLSDKLEVYCTICKRKRNLNSLYLIKDNPDQLCILCYVWYEEFCKNYEQEPSI